MNEVRLIDANALPTHVAYEDENGYPCEFVYKCDIDAAPTVDAEVVRHGKWITRKLPRTTTDFTVNCSVCGAHGDPSWIRCQRCEARMDLDAKEEENG